MRAIPLSLSGVPERVFPVSLLSPSEKRRPAIVLPINATMETQPATDEALMASLRAEQKDALAEIFRRYSRLVYSIGLRVLRDAGEAEEVVQEVFLYLYQKARLFDETKGTAKAWIVQIAHHRSLDRSKFLHRRHFYVGTDTAELADTLTGADNPERDLGSKLNEARLREAFESLSDNQRRTLEMFFFEGLEFKEIAGQMNESVENVRHFYYRGLQKLRKNSFVQALRGIRGQ